MSVVRGTCVTTKQTPLEMENQYKETVYAFGPFITAVIKIVVGYAFVSVTSMFTSDFLRVRQIKLLNLNSITPTLSIEKFPSHICVYISLYAHTLNDKQVKHKKTKNEKEKLPRLQYT